MAVLDVNNLKKIYSSKPGYKGVQALTNVTFSAENGEFIAIMGESGSGKTTLLQILATLDKPTSGSVVLDGKDITLVKDKELAEFRRKNLGFVFQDFRLLDNFTVRDNILLPLVLADKKVDVMENLLKSIAETFEITNLLNKFPYEISGGQKQRVAVARAVITKPHILLADEPTGALDSRASLRLLNLFEKLNDEGQTILMVTHSVKAACFAKRVMFIKDGVVFHQIYKASMNENEMYQKISDTLTMIMAGGELRGFPKTV